MMECRLLILLAIGLLPTFGVGLQCPSCTYVNTSMNIPGIKQVIEPILRLFGNEKCTRPVNGPTPGITEITCAPPDGRDARCSFYKGSIDAEVMFTSISLQIYNRGCYYSLPANVPSNGCHNRNHINEDNSILQQVMGKFSYAIKVVSFKGDICLCSDTYCQSFGQTSGQTSGSSSEFGSSCRILSVFPVLFVLLIH